LTIEENEYITYLAQTEPSEALPAQPEWVSRFKSFENNVIVEQIDVEWEWAQ